MKYRGMKLFFIWTFLITGSLIALYGMYLGFAWMVNTGFEAMAKDQDIRIEQVRERVSASSLDYYLRHK